MKVPKKSFRMNFVAAQSLDYANADGSIWIAGAHGFTFIIIHSIDWTIPPVFVFYDLTEYINYNSIGYPMVRAQQVK